MRHRNNNNITTTVIVSQRDNPNNILIIVPTRITVVMGVAGIVKISNLIIHTKTLLTLISRQATITGRVTLRMIHSIIKIQIILHLLVTTNTQIRMEAILRVSIITMINFNLIS